jgi:broad specificity phosphatase PhoE
MYIFVARHGPSRDNELLEREYVKSYAPKITKAINRYGGITKIYTSPINRCADSAEILGEFLNVNNIVITDNLARFEGNDGDMRKKERAIAFGKSLRNSNENILLVTHSSIMRHVLAGLYNREVNSFYVNDASLTIFDSKKQGFELFNKDW